MWAIAAASFMAIFAVNVPLSFIVVGAAVIGFAGDRLAPSPFKVGCGADSANKSFAAALVDDGTSASVHALFKWRRLLQVAAVGAFYGRC